MDPLDLNVVGVDDGAFSPTKTKGERALLLVVLFRRSRIQTIRIGTIAVDGVDAAVVLISLLERLNIDLVMLSGISFAGFNLIDISKLADVLKKPVIAISGEKPHNRAVRSALKGHFVDWERRWAIVQSAGKFYVCRPLKEEPDLYFEVKGASPDFARRVISRTAHISRLPEPIRVSRIIAKGLSPLTGVIRS